MSIETDAVTVRRFADEAVDAARTGAEVFGGGGGLGFHTSGGYLDRETVIAMEFDGSTVLLTTDGLDVIDMIEYPPGAVSQRPTPGAPGTWTTFGHERGEMWPWRLER